MDICFSFASLRSWLVFFSESDSAPRALPFSSSQGSVKKNCGAKDLSGRWQESSRRLNARVPRHHCRRREDSPIHFTQHDQRPSAVSNMIIWEVFGRARVNLFASEDNSHCPIFFTKSTDALVHEWPSLPLFAGTQASQGTTAQAYSNSPLCSYSSFWKQPVVDPLETGPPLSSERHYMASTARVMGPACVAARREPFVLPERVLDTMAEARAPSTRRLYALKWSIFLAWSQDRDLDPVTSNVSVVLSFLPEMLDKQRSSSTIKVYATAITAFHALLLADRWADIVW